MKRRIYLSPPHLEDDSLRYLQSALESNWIAPIGPDVEAFEDELAARLQVENLIVTNSGTSAIHLGLLALDVKPGDEIICTTFTFCASINPIVYCGASPVFIDSEEESWNLDPVLLEQAVVDRIRKVGKKPKAIIVVHTYGMPAKMNSILEVSRRYGIPVLEDAAEALGSSYMGTSVGTLGTAGVFSFNGNKIITTSSGGALCSSESELIAKARYYAAEAKEPTPYYEHKDVGYNYRMSNVLAALGRSQLKVLSERIKRRRAIFDFYVSQLRVKSCIRFQPEPKGSVSNRWLTAIAFSGGAGQRDQIRAALANEQIESRLLWKPMHLQPVFEKFPSYNNGVSENLFEGGLCLPSGSALTEEDLHRISDTIKNAL